MKTLFKCSIIALLLCMSCSSSDDSNSGSQDPVTFTIDNLIYRSYPIPQTIPNYEGSASYALAIFDEDPDATRYTARFYDTEFSNLHFEISWLPGEPIPAPAFMHESTDGYVNGVIDGQYHIAALKNGCQGGIVEPFDVGPCNFISGVNTQANIAGLASIGGKVEITIEFD